MLREPKYRSRDLFAVLTAITFTGCDSGWRGPFKKPGPLPLSSTNAPITRMIKTRATFEVTLVNVYWDEGKGPLRLRNALNRLSMLSQKNCWTG